MVNKNADNPKTLPLTEQTLLSLVAHALFGAPLQLTAKVDWRAVLREARAQAVLPLVAYQEELPPEVAELAGSVAQAVLANNVQIEWSHRHTHEVMTAAHIPYVILKGCASASYYPEPLYRTMGDVDFLVARDDLPRADQALREDGFTPWEEPHICHIVYRKPPQHWELHFEPAGIPEGEAGERVRRYLEDIFETAVETPVGDGTLFLPDDFHHGLILLLHTCHHLTGEGVGLRHLCDWAVLVNRLSDEQFRELFEEKLKAVGLWRFAQLLTQVSIRYLGLPARAWAMEQVDDELLAAIIGDILSGGNFGKKDDRRGHELLMISNRGKNGVGKTSMGGQLLASVNRIVYEKWPITRKIKPLLPVGWLFFGVRYVVRIGCGKRKPIAVGATVSGARERRAIYQEFHLYEV